jgi:GNAT superfamily N-acetyltransferase
MTTIRPMTAEDLPLLLRLRAQAGWNQTEADLRRFLDLSAGGSFIAESDGAPAGTGCTFVFGSTAWIAMVLVEQSQRGRGIGTALMRHALAYLDGRGVERIRLDATPMGRPVYEKLGFVAEYNVLRYEGEVPHLDTAPASPEIVEPARAHLEQVRQFDVAVTRADRCALLRELYREPSRFRVIDHDGTIEGYLSFRPGARAWQIGPCLATDARGTLLLEWAFFRTQLMRVYVDIPENNHGPIAATEGIGLRVQRTLTRMCRGPFPTERTDMIWASSGPEMG